MEGSKSENTGDINEALTTPMKRVLRSRIVEVDNNSSASCGSNITDSASSQLNSHADEVKSNLEVDTTSSSKKEVSEKTELKCSPEKRLDLAEDNQSRSSLSPVSQCGSEASNVSVRVLRNSKCVLIKLESIDKVIADSPNRPSSNKEGKSTKAILGSVSEENLGEECNENQKNEGKDINGDLNKINHEDNEVADSKEENESDKIASNSEINEGSLNDSGRNNKTDESDVPVDGNNKCETLSDNHVECVVNNNNGKSIEDNDSIGKEGRLIIDEDIEGNSGDTLIVEAEDPSKVSSIGNNVSDSTESKEILNDRSNEGKLPQTNETLEHSIRSCGNESDTTEESEFTIDTKNISKRKPVSINKVSEECMDSDSNQTHGNVDKPVDDEVVNEDKTEKEIFKTIIGSEKADNQDAIDIVVHSESDEESTVVSAQHLIPERINENDVSQDSVNSNTAKASENLSLDNSKNEELPELTEGKSKSYIHEEQESVQEPFSEDLEVEKQIENNSDKGREKNTASYFKSCQKNVAAAEDLLTRSNKKKVLEPDIKNKSRLNLTNVVNLLNVDKSSMNEVLAESDTLDSDSETEVSDTVTSRGKITKHVEPVSSPVEYYGIGKDLLKGIIKEAVEGAVIEVKEELKNMKNQLTSITTLLNGMKRGKKRKFDDMNTVNIDDETLDKQSLSSLSSLSTADELMAKITVPLSKPKSNSSTPAKGTKTKEDLIKKLLDDVSGQLNVPVKAKKKRKLSDLSADFKKNKKETMLVNSLPVVKESVALTSFSNDSQVNKKKKKKKLKLLQDNSEALLVGKSVKNKVNDGSFFQGVFPDEDKSIDVSVKKNKKKKKLDPDNVFEKISDNFSDTIFDLENFSNVQEFSKKKKKKGNKNKCNTLENDTMVLTSESNFPNKTLAASEELGSKKKKKKKNLGKFNSASSEIGSSFTNELNVFGNLSTLNCDETDKKKKKKKKLNASVNVGGDDSCQLNKLKKKKKKLNLLGDQLSSSAIGGSVNNGFVDAQGFESFSYGNSSYLDDQGLLKKMKSWKSKNKNQLYRATPYKDDKNKKMKLSTSMN